MPHEIRDQVVDFVRRWSEKTEVAQRRFVPWLGFCPSKFHDWVGRYGKVNEHNRWVPRDHWLEQWEKEAIIAFYKEHPFDGYRRLTYMLLDAGTVAAGASSVYRVLSGAGLLAKWNRKKSKKGTGFVQPLKPHEHWHVDISYLNLGGTFFYLCSVLDGYSRMIVHWELGEHMTEADIECVIQAALEKYPGARPRIISDNGPQFIAKDFKEFIRVAGLTHVRTSPYYPQSNGKLERWHGSYKTEGLRPQAPPDKESARKITAEYVDEYNEVRLHSAIGYITPKDKLAGRADEIFAERDRKLEAARIRRAQARQQQRQQRADVTEEKETALSLLSLGTATANGNGGPAAPATNQAVNDAHPAAQSIQTEIPY